MESQQTIVDRQIFLNSPSYNQRVQIAFDYYKKFRLAPEQEANNFFSYCAERAELEIQERETNRKTTDRRISKALQYYAESADGTLTEKETLNDICRYHRSNADDVGVMMIALKHKSRLTGEEIVENFLAARTSRKNMPRAMAKEALKLIRLDDLSTMLNKPKVTP